MPFGIRFGIPGKKKPEQPAAGAKLPAEEERPSGEEKEKVPAVLEKELGPKYGTVAEPLEMITAEVEEERPPLSHEYLPLGVSSFDELIEKRGVERGSTLLVSGGCGTGKSTFCIQSVYNGIMNRNEKAVFITFEERPEKIKRHMKENFGWDLDKLEQEKRLAILKLNPFKIARSVEASLAQQRKALLIKVEQISLPFMPDRIVVDSLSALSIAFMGNTENYRYYVRHMFEILDNYNSLNFVISETEQDPGIYSRTGMEEFLADGVIVLYNIKVGRTRERALEILKLRCSNHVKEMVPYQITEKGIIIFRGSEIEKQLKDFSAVPLPAAKAAKKKKG